MTEYLTKIYEIREQQYKELKRNHIMIGHYKKLVNLRDQYKEQKEHLARLSKTENIRDSFYTCGQINILSKIEIELTILIEELEKALFP